MPYRRARRARKPRRAAPRIRGGRNLVRRTAMRNVFKYSRYCPDTTLINGPLAGNLLWDAAPSNWEITAAPAADDNGLYQFGGVMRFQLDDVINPGDFSNLYDRYKITGAKITITPLVNTSYVALTSNGNTQTGALPVMYYATDYDDSALPGSALDLLTKMDCKQRRLDKPFSIFVKNPKVVVPVSNGTAGATSTAMTMNPGFANTTVPDINFRGLKFYVRDFSIPATSPTAHQNSLVRITVKYFMTFKDPQ